jgi:hypothetical protein
MPAGDYMIRTEHEVHGWLAQQLRVEFPHSRSYRLSPLLVAGGYALTTAIGVELPTGSKVRFVRVDGGLVPLTRWGTFAPRVGILGRPPRPFEVKGLLPGRYRVSVHPSRIVSGRVVAPERVKISVAQGTVEIGPRGREGVVLQMPDPNR